MTQLNLIAQEIGEERMKTVAGNHYEAVKVICEDLQNCERQLEDWEHDFGR
jgi:hypothetical protein